MKICLIESYFTGSHAAWARGFQMHSRHGVEILPLEGQYWKWRMHGGAVTLARKYLSQDTDPDVLLATDMLDLTTFLSLTRSRTSQTPVALYFHENQLTYPWSPEDRDVANQRDRHYGFINYASALAADVCLFNSQYHQESFISELSCFLRNFPDHRELDSVDHIASKSRVLHLGLLLKSFEPYRIEDNQESDPVILWNHRWEYDKNPDDFFDVILRLADSGESFRLVVLGENFSQQPEIFEQARRRLGDRILQYGYVEHLEEYAHWLCKSDLLPVTSVHDFFGASVVEAAYCGCMPLLPRRLSYPEIIPEDQFPECFYDDADDLFEKLKIRLQTPRYEKQDLLREHVEQYDWRRMSGVYDDVLEGLVRFNHVTE